MGGDSISAIQLIKTIEERMKVKLPIELLMQGHSIQRIADFIDPSLSPTSPSSPDAAMDSEKSVSGDHKKAGIYIYSYMNYRDIYLFMY